MDVRRTAEPTSLTAQVRGSGSDLPATLFRAEVIEYQAAHRQWGSIIELRPVRAQSLTWGTVLVAGLTVLFLCMAQYTRKETVSGYLRPTLGIAKVFVPQPGVIRDVRVTEGSEVKKGQPLMTVETALISASGRDLNQASLETLTTQRAMILRQVQAEEVRTESERNRLGTLIDGQRHEIDLLKGQIRRQDDRVALTRSLLQSAQTLAGRGVMADVELKRRQQEMLDQERIRDDLNQQLAVRMNRLAETLANLEQLPTIRNQTLQGLRNDLAWIDQRIAESEGRQAYVVVAPASGRVVTLQAAQGQPADPRQLQMTIVPTGSTLVAELLVPSRAAGFVAVGQPIRILYEAYPYQKYGTYGGRVERVAGSVVQASEATGPISLSEPAYKVVVALDSPNVQVDGQAVPLRPDMVLRADILLDKRTILQWLLSPLGGAHNAIDADPLLRFVRETWATAWIGIRTNAAAGWRWAAESSASAWRAALAFFSADPPASRSRRADAPGATRK